MFANEDIYTGTADPTSTINPKITGAFYINKKTAKLFVCKDNTLNKNIWEMCNPDIDIASHIQSYLNKYYMWPKSFTWHNIKNSFKFDTIYRNTTNDIQWLFFSNVYLGLHTTYDDPIVEINGEPIYNSGGDYNGLNICHPLLPNDTYKCCTYNYISGGTFNYNNPVAWKYLYIRLGY